MWKIFFCLLTTLFFSARLAADTFPLKGQIVSSTLVNAKEYIHGDGQYDLFLSHVPGWLKKRLTDHNGDPQDRRAALGGAIREPKISPDGRRVLFLAIHAGLPEDYRIINVGAAPFFCADFNIWLLDLTHGIIRSVTTGESGWNNVQWSPDGKWFCAVTPARGGSIVDSPPQDVYVFNAHTFQRVRVARTPNSYVRISWANNSCRLYVEHSVAGKTSVFSVSANGVGEKAVVVVDKDGTEYRFSTDQRFVAFSRDISLQVARQEKGRLIPTLQLRTHNIKPGEPSPFSMPIWSPGSNKVAVTETVQDASRVTVQTRIHIVDAALGKEISVFLLPAGAADTSSVLAWSRDGQWLLVRVVKGSVQEGLLAVSVKDGHTMSLYAPNKATHGLDWHED